MMPTPPDPSTVPTSKPIVTMLLPGLIVGGVIGALGGATLNAPPPATDGQPDVLIHQLSFFRPGPNVAGERAYVTSIKHLLDGGRRVRDEGEVRCGPPGDAGWAVINALDNACAPGAARWLHNIELRHNRLDGGVAVTAYRTRFLVDGGLQDDGLVPCDIDIQSVANVAWNEAVNCAEGVLDSP